MKYKTEIYNSQPINWNHPLNRNLISWWYPIPNKFGFGSTNSIMDLCFNNKANIVVVTVGGGTSWGYTSYLKKGFFFLNDTIYINCGNNILPKITNKITCSAWVRNLSSGQGTFYLANTQITGAGYDFGLYNTAGNKCAFFIKNESSTVVNGGSTTSMTVGEWIHTVGVYDGSNIYVYVNGKLEDTDPQTGNINNAGYNTTIGGGWSNNLFFGQISDVRIYNRALSDVEIYNLYKESLNPETLLFNRERRIKYFPFRYRINNCSGVINSKYIIY